MTRNEQHRLMKKAGELRRIRRDRMGRDSRPVSLEDLALEILATEVAAETTEPVTGAQTRGLVTWVGPKTCSVALATGAEEECLLPKHDHVAVGDDVATSPHGTGMIVSHVYPRRAVLSRPDPFAKGHELVIAANIDVVGIVAAFVAPVLHPRMIDRYMVAVQRGGAKPLLLLTKTDLLTPENREAEEDKVRPYLSLMPVIRCSPATGQGMDDVRAWLQGQTSSLVGKSGVGKSSLLNALVGQTTAATKTVGTTNKGRHTTTSSSLYDIGGGTRVIDTPGVRAFGLADVDKDSLKWYFPEFEEWQSDCRFNDCTHSHEPGCVVRQAAETGQLSSVRYATYRRILETL